MAINFMVNLAADGSIQIHGICKGFVIVLSKGDSSYLRAHVGRYGLRQATSPMGQVVNTK